MDELIFFILEYEEKLSEGSKLAKFYLNENDEPSTRRCLEADSLEAAALTQPKKKFKNPFRSPVRVVNENEQIVSR